MTFFRTALFLVPALLALAGCKSGSSDVSGFDAGDGAVRFDAHPMDATGDAPATDMGVDVDMSCGTSGCVGVTQCMPVGTAVMLDTTTNHTPSGVGAASTASGHVVAFHAFRSSALNVVTRAIARDGTAMPETVVTSTIGTAKNPALAFAGTNGLVAYELNNLMTGMFTHLTTEPLSASGAMGGAAMPVTPGAMGEGPRLPSVAALGASDFVVAWTVAPMTGTTRAVVAHVGADGTPMGAPTDVTAGTMSILSAALATGPGARPALVTVEQDTTALAVRVRPIAADGSVATTALDAVRMREVTGGVTGARIESGTLVAWGEIVGGARQEVHLVFVPDVGTAMAERIATIGLETGTDPHLLALTTGIVLAYRGGPPTDRGVRALGVGAFGTLAGTPTTILPGAEDPSQLAISAIDADGVVVVLSDSTAGGTQVRAMAADCGGT